MSVAFGSINLTAVPNGEDLWGSHARIREADCKGVNSYSAGYTITPADYGLTVIRAVELVACSIANRWATYVASGMPGGVSGGVINMYTTSGEVSGDDSATYYRLLVQGE